VIEKGVKIKNPTKLLKLIISSDLFDYIADSLSTKRATNRDGSVDEKLKDEARKRIYQKADLLLELSKSYDDAFRFINAITLGGNETSQGEGVNLLSIHASKGLEFKEVYIVDLMDGRFPNRKLLSKNQTESIDEERRLFYVAVTRAKEILRLSYTKYDKIRDIEYKPSPFLEEAGLIKISS
jgi:DNA helicase-2/ATP-dependent DNA helicase PcrA